MDPLNVLAKFEIRSFSRSRDTRGYPKNWAVPGYAHAPFSPKILMGFFRMDPLNVLAKFEIRSFFRSRDNRGYRKKFGQSLDMPTPLFSKNFNGLLITWTL